MWLCVYCQAKFKNRYPQTSGIVTALTILIQACTKQAKNFVLSKNFGFLFWFFVCDLCAFLRFFSMKNTRIIKQSPVTTCRNFAIHGNCNQIQTESAYFSSCEFSERQYLKNNKTSQQTNTFRQCISEKEANPFLLPICWGCQFS